MGTPWKKLLLWSFVAVLLAGLGYSLLRTSQLVQDFEESTEQKEFVPAASYIEISENDEESRKTWWVKAKQGSSNGDFDEVEASAVQAIVYNQDEKPKLKISSDKALINRQESRCMLRENVLVKMEEQNIEMTASQMKFEGKNPIEALGEVVLFLKPDGSSKIYAEKALITQKLTQVTLLQIKPSPLDKNLQLQGGRLIAEVQDEQPREIKILDGVTVSTGQAVCRANQLTLHLRNGEPYLAVFSGNVRVNSSDLRANSGNLKLTIVGGKPQIATLTGSPVVHKRGNRLWGSVITYNFINKNIAVRGNVKSS